MTDHSWTTHLSLDRASVLKALFKAIDLVMAIDKKAHGYTLLSFHMDRIKHLVD